MHGGEDSPEKGKLRVVGDNKHESGPQELIFMFNPAKLSIAAKAKYEQPPQPSARGQGASRAQFTGPEPRTMTLELWFDDWMESSTTKVTEAVTTLVSWTRPTKKSVDNKKKPNPPLVILNWGEGEARGIHVDTQKEFFPMVLNSVSYEYSLFDKKGKPMRAKVSISGQEVPDAPAGTNPTSGSLEARYGHMVVEGDTLASVAYGYYGEARLWRGLAAANHIDDPMRVRPGTPLHIPPIEDAAKFS